LSDIEQVKESVYLSVTHLTTDLHMI